MKKKNLPSAAILLILANAACDEDISELEQTELLSPEAEALEIVDNLEAAGFHEDEIELHLDGTVYVGGDAEVNLEASREMLGLDPHSGEFEGFRQYRTTNLVSQSVKMICVDGKLYTGAMSQALDIAISRLNALDVSFSVQRTTGFKAGCNAYITAKLNSGYSGVAGFPSLGKPYGQISVGTSIAPYYGTTVLAHVILHELGHCLGLRHSDYYDRSVSCGGSPYNEGTAGVGAHHIPGTPSIATMNGSVMNSCYNAGSTGVFSSGDVTAIVKTYPDRSCQDACGAEKGECINGMCNGPNYMCFDICHTKFIDCIERCFG